MLQIEPSNIIQGTVLYGQKWVSRNSTIPITTAVQPEVRMASTTEKMAYFDSVLLILSICCLRLGSLGRQKRPILPSSFSKYLRPNNCCRGWLRTWGWSWVCSPTLKSACSSAEWSWRADISWRIVFWSGWAKCYWVWEWGVVEIGVGCYFWVVAT